MPLREQTSLVGNGLSYFDVSAIGRRGGKACLPKPGGVAFLGKDGGTTLYPSIYRGGPNINDLQHRFKLLEEAGSKLAKLWKARKIVGSGAVKYKRYIQWSILQHYEIMETPLLDLTHSLRVACSFAQHKNTDATCYVYVLGLPHVTNRITVNSEQEIVNIRLLSICPPDALRPHFQEGYMVGTPDITSELVNNPYLDFRNRLVAKFAIPRTKRFWGDGFERIPERSLFPINDKISALCDEINKTKGQELHPGRIGEYIKDLASLESQVLSRARDRTSRDLSIGEALRFLARSKTMESSMVEDIETLRSVRNQIVHSPNEFDIVALERWSANLQHALRKIRKT